MKQTNLLLINVLLLISCNTIPNENKNELKVKGSNDFTNKINEKPKLLDSIINLGIHESVLPDVCEFNNSKAIKYLYKYFKLKGVLPREKVVINEYGPSKMCISFDTIYKFSSNKYCGGIISYWLGEADLNGHCFLPSHSIIQLTRNGYKIKNENFIPDNYILDSIKGTTLYGFIYDCGGDEPNRPFKITLN